MSDLLAYVGLLFAAFTAATILPMQSEALLVAMLMRDYSPILLVLIASTGNILGSLVNWMLGRSIDRFRHHRWFPASDRSLDRAQRWYHRYGRWSLLLSWVPVIGDALTVIAGVLREPLPVFLLLVTIAKLGRYLVLTAATLSLV